MQQNVNPQNIRVLHAQEASGEVTLEASVLCVLGAIQVHLRVEEKQEGNGPPPPHPRENHLLEGRWQSDTSVLWEVRRVPWKPAGAPLSPHRPPPPHLLTEGLGPTAAVAEADVTAGPHLPS